LSGGVGRLVIEGTKGQTMELKWAMVPQEATAEIEQAAADYLDSPVKAHGLWAAMLAAAPEPPHLSMTPEEAQTFQDWAGMDGATAFLLIERHSNGWGDVARMMDAWLAANRETPNVE
jgi:hypothetical protein